MPTPATVDPRARGAARDSIFTPVCVPILILIGVLPSPVSRAVSQPIVLGEHVEYAAGQAPGGVAIADVDGDGHPDVLVANLLSEDVSVLRNLQNGTFASQVRVPAGGRARSIAVGDLDGDAHVDIAVGLQESSKALAVLRNRGDGSFFAPELYGPPGRVAFQTLIAHLDPDGHPDIASARNFGDGEVVVLLNAGDGTFPDEDLYHPAPDVFTAGVASGDLDGDSSVDLVAVFAYSSEAPVRLFNEGNGTFEIAPPFDPVTHVSPAIGVRDLDGDQHNDIIATSGGLRIYFNDGSGGFGAPEIHHPEVLLSSATRIVLADLDGDGAQDVVVPGGASNRVSVLLNDGSGHLEQESLHATGAYASQAAVADLNGDQRPDIVVSNRNGDSVSVLLNAGTTSAVGPEAATGRPVVGMAVQPNPARAAASAIYRLERAARVRVVVYDAAGRLRRIVLDRQMAPGLHRAGWDLRDGSGAAVAPGIYFFRVDAGELRWSRKVVVLP